MICPTRSLRAPTIAAQVVLTAFYTLIAFLFCFEGLWSNAAHLLYAASGILGLCMMAFCFVYGRLFRKTDVWLLAAFLLYSWLSAAISFGPSLSHFFSRFFCIWCLLLGMYYALRAAPNPDQLLRWYVPVSIACLSTACVYVLVNATASLFMQYPGQNTLKGCFQLGRLCGFSNANVFGFACAALVMLSCFGWLITKSRLRILFVISSVIGWFTLGMTNCRTGIVGISICLSLFAIAPLQRRFRRAGAWSWVAAICLASLLAFVSVQSMYLPTILYRRIMTIVGKGYPYLVENLRRLQVRRVTDRVGTVSDRFLVWKTCLHDTFKTLRRALFGVSFMNQDRIGGVYAGHHEILTSHAHNTFLNLLWQFGLIGLSFWLILLARWGRIWIRTMRRTDAAAPERFAACCAVGLLAMGMVESVPLTHITLCYLPILFMILCAYSEVKGETTYAA